MQSTVLSPEHQILLEQLRSSGIKPPQAVLSAQKTASLGCIEHNEKYFYIPETSRPIKYEDHQKIILNIIAGTHSYPTLLPFYSTVEYSCPKKEGKTATSGGYARFRAEQTTTRDEILFFANDETQSRGRAYAAIQTSIELDPRYDVKRRELVDSNSGHVIWRIIEDYIEHVPTNTKVRAVNVDYRGEAGANPSLTVWTECWGYDTDKQLKLFEEMTPVLTRFHSQRYLEGYAGYTGKSKVQEYVENLATKPELGARQLTRDDIPDWPWPDEELLPLYVNDSAGVFAYLDRGPIARTRMPWLIGPEADKYYVEQSLTLTPEQFDRLHNNYWVSPTEAFIPIEWWYQCEDTTLPELTPSREPLTRAPIDLTMVPHVDDPDYANLFARYIDPSNWQQIGTDAARNVPLILSCDASVSGDCTALTLTSRHPQRYNDVALRLALKWDPPRGGKIDYERTPNTITGLSLWQQIIDICMRYNVVQFAYDEWQMHHLVNQLRNLGIVWCRAFGQSTPRDIADKQLYDLIKLRRIAYNSSSHLIDSKAMTEHLQNASRQQRAKEDTKLHIVKSADDRKIDLTVSLSMGCAECLRLDM